jgi:hypothetical protein
LDHGFIDIAPDPILARFKGLDQRMLGGVKMFCGMPMGRIVAASNVPANQADAQVYPTTADTQAIFTALCAGCDAVNLIQMGTVFRHDLPGVRKPVASFKALRLGHSHLSIGSLGTSKIMKKRYLLKLKHEIWAK